MDITPVFGTVVGGSNPSGSTKYTNTYLAAGFCDFGLDAVMFCEHSKPRTGVAKIASADEQLFVTTRCYRAPLDCMSGYPP